MRLVAHNARHRETDEKMLSANSLHAVLVSLVFAFSALAAVSAKAGDDDNIGTIQENPEQYNKEGFYKNPTCDYDIRIKNVLTNFSKQPPTGIKGLSNDWDMEIYANTPQSAWTLVGKSRAPGARTRQSCILARGYISYAQQKWFVEYFK